METILALIFADIYIYRTIFDNFKVALLLSSHRERSLSLLSQTEMIRAEPFYQCINTNIGLRLLRHLRYLSLHKDYGIYKYVITKFVVMR